jgi:hypothetical protein
MKSNLSLKHNDKLMNLKHNNRAFDEKEWGQTTNKHINRELTKYNTTFIQEPIEKAYEKAFGEALKEYNEKQKKKSRRIDNYYEYIKEKVDKAKGKKKGNTTYNLQDEVILTIGNKEMWDGIRDSFHDHYKDPKKAEEAFIQYKKQESDATFKEFLDDFQAKHKHLYVFNAVAHYDEAGAPHMHMNFFGMAEGVEKGLRIQPRTTRAIAQDLDGDFYEKMQATSKAKNEFEKENRRRKKEGLEPLQADRKAFMSASADVYTQFLTESKQIFIDKARAHGFEYVPGKTNSFKDVYKYKEIVAKAEQEAKEEAEKILTKANEQIKQYKEEKLNEINEEAGNKQAKIKELDETLDTKKAEFKELQEAANTAKKEKDEATREARIAKQNAELAKQQADSFKAELERVKAENQAKFERLDSLDEDIKVKEQQLANKEAQLSNINENIKNKQAVLSKVNEQYDDKMLDIEKRQILKQYDELAGIPKHDDKDVRQNTFNNNELIIKKEHYENLKHKASLFDRSWDLRDALKGIADTLKQKINELPIVQALRQTIKDLNAQIEDLTEKNKTLKAAEREQNLYLTSAQKEQVKQWISEGKEYHDQLWENAKKQMKEQEQRQQKQQEQSKEKGKNKQITIHKRER